MATEAQKDRRLARLQHEHTERSPAPEPPQEHQQKQRLAEDAPRRASRVIERKAEAGSEPVTISNNDLD